MPTPADAIRHLRAYDQSDQGRAETPDTGTIDAERLTAIEACALTVRAWNPSIIPGLLQTTRYAAGAIKMGIPSLPSDELMRRAHARAARIDAFLARWNSVDEVGQAWFIVGEQALTQPVVNEHAHANQLMHLLNLSASHPKIQIQVMPDYQPTPGRAGQFAVYGLEHAEDAPAPRLGYLETPVGAWYTTRGADVARLYSSFSDMIGAALTPADTRAFLKEVLHTCWGPTTEPSSGSPATATPETASRSLDLPPDPSQ